MDFLDNLMETFSTRAQGAIYIIEQVLLPLSINAAYRARPVVVPHHDVGAGNSGER
jgi:hypothetical protein